jgi:hypothetical protein
MSLADGLQRAAKMAGREMHVHQLPPAISRMKDSLRRWVGSSPPPAGVLAERLQAALNASDSRSSE